MRTRAFCLAAAFFVVLSSCTAYGFELRGTVTDKDGTPAGGASLWLLEDDRLQCGTADPSGAFVFAGLEVAPMTLVAYKEGYAWGGISGPIWGPDTVHVKLAAPAAVTLRVIDSDYAPVEGAFVRQVTLENSLALPLERLSKAGFPFPRSNKDGLLVLSALPVDSHVQLVVGHRLLADSHVDYLPVGGERQNIVLERGVPIRGRVTSDGKGIAEARIRVARQGVAGLRVFAAFDTGPEGFYAGRVEEGRYEVSARHRDYASPKPREIMLTDDGENVADFVLLPRKRLSGSTTLANEEPAGGIILRYWVDNILYTETRSRYDGLFTLGVPPGEGLLQVVPPDGFMTGELASIPVNMGEADTAELSPIALEPLPIVEGQVTDPEGSPVPSALVSSVNFHPAVWALTNDAGQFAILVRRMPQDPRGRFTVEHPKRFLRASFSVDLHALEPVSVALDTYDPLDAVPDKENTESALRELADKDAPPLTCRAWINSEPLDWPALDNRITVLTFWASFDERPEAINRIEFMRVLDDMWRDVADVALVAIHDANGTRAELAGLTKEAGIRFPVGLDAEPFVTFGRYGIAAIPETVIVDRHGKLRYYGVDEARLPTLVKLLRREP